MLNENNFAEYNGCAPGNDWDFTRFNPAHFQHIEKCTQALMNLGIEADLIVMHPYDRWGFSMMKAEDDDRTGSMCWHVFPHTEMYGGPWLMSMI